MEKMKKEYVSMKHIPYSYPSNIEGTYLDFALYFWWPNMIRQENLQCIHICIYACGSNYIFPIDFVPNVIPFGAK